MVKKVSGSFGISWSRWCKRVTWLIYEVSLPTQYLSQIYKYNSKLDSKLSQLAKKFKRHLCLGKYTLHSG